MLSIEMLQGRAQEQAYENASVKIRKIFRDIERPEFIDSLRAFCAKYHISYSDSVLDIDSPSYVETVLTEIMNETESVREALAHDIRTIYKDEADGHCSLTGVDHDCLFFDYFVVHGPPTAESLPVDLDKAVAFAVDKFIAIWRANARRREFILEFIEADGIFFDEEGEIIEKE